MRTTIRNPAACTDDELHAFETLAIQGGEASAAGLGSHLRRAYSLGFVHDGNQLVAIAAIKQPAPEFQSAVFTAAGVGGAAAFDFELGWVVTADKFKRLGIGSALCGQLLDHLEPGAVFATTRSDNDGMLHILARLGFVQLGSEFCLVDHPGKRVRLLAKHR